MIKARRNGGRAGAAALIALVFVSACAGPGQRSRLGGQAPGYEIGATGRQLSAAAARDPVALRRAEARLAGTGSSGSALPYATRKAAPTRAKAVATARNPARAGSATSAPILTAAANVAAGSAALATPGAGGGGGPEQASQTPIMLGQARVEPRARGQAGAASDVSLPRSPAPWALLAAILAGFVAALALAWVLRPRSRSTPPAEAYPAPAAANDRDEPRRPARRAQTVPPKVTILAKAGGR